jgi:hypothetical protein
MTDLKRPHEPGRCFEGGTAVYVRGAGWPVNVGDAPNPWDREHWNLTHQGQIYRRDQAEANRLAQAAGHKDALSARVGNAK